MATLADVPAGRMTFWQKLALGLALFIVFGFAQFAARGFVDYGKAPVWLHFHGIAMLSWLALIVVQPTLAARGNLALHRRLGWLGAALAALIVGLGSYVSVQTIAIAHVPPFFTAPYFLALTQIGVVAFGGLVVAAILRRRETQWHQRLIMGATILIMEPALGRVLPMPLMVPWGEWAVMVVQLLVLGIVMRHDRKTLGAIHPATTSVVIVVVLTHILVELAARTQFMASAAARIAGA
ncbi:MAG: adenylate cyclase [Novosphingobium sp.]|nr:adenylate cyclase [Novosphingobium sp.]